ncbi:MAG TPA: BON domain-containing protein [Bryobacteraceae bacterium]|jgi:hyperosmotically inducible protein|nr:BON domain-containing protein [Bryobacteraceae bacterium]
MKPNRLLLSLLVPEVALVSAIAADKPVSDDYINDSVRQKLAADQVVKGGDLDVQVKDGVVTLNGKVREGKQKDKAERIAKKIRGVKSVVNNIKIEKP